MIWIVIGAVIGLVTGILLAIGDADGVGNGILQAVTGLLIGAVVGTFLALVLSGIASIWLTPEYEILNTIEIDALNDSAVTNGKFYLGGGVVEEEVYYYYIKKSGDGKVIDRISAKNATIYEIDSGAPRIEKLTATWSNKTLYWLFFPLKGNIVNIYVPKGSVTTDFTIDLKN